MIRRDVESQAQQPTIDAHLCSVLEGRQRELEAINETSAWRTIYEYNADSREPDVELLLRSRQRRLDRNRPVPEVAGQPRVPGIVRAAVW